MFHRVTASIRAERLAVVLEALTDVGIKEVTVTEARGLSGAAVRIYRGVPYLSLAPRVVLDLVVSSETSAIVAELVASNARTGAADDGTVWLAPLDGSINIRTGEEES